MAYILGAAAVGAVGYSTYQLCEHYDIAFSQEQPWYDEPVYNQEQTNVEIEPISTDDNGIKKKPKFCGKELGDDPSKCPGEGFEWKGNDEPGSGRGSWVRGKGSTKEILFPDLNHPKPKGPHWDYYCPEFPEGTRLYPDGTWEIKK